MLQPLVPCGEGAFALDAVAFFFVADGFAEFFFERDEEVEGDVGGLELFVVGVGDVVDERAVGGEARGRGGFYASGQGGGVAACEEASGDGLGVAFDAGELAGDEDGGVRA